MYMCREESYRDDGDREREERKRERESGESYIERDRER